MHVCVSTVLGGTHDAEVLSPKVELRRCGVSSNGWHAEPVPFLAHSDPASFLYLEIPETDPGGKQTVLELLTSLELKS